MTDKFVYKQYSITNNAHTITDELFDFLSKRGYVKTGTSDNVTHYRYPSLFFTSKKPLTCVSQLSIEPMTRNGDPTLRVGMTFTKIRIYNILLMVMLCIALPAMLGILSKGKPDVPPMSVIGLPLGLMVHYHVRARVFKAFNRVVMNLDQM